MDTCYVNRAIWFCADGWTTRLCSVVLCLFACYANLVQSLEAVEQTGQQQ